MDIQDILNSVDIGEVISERIELTRKGSRYYGLCPFHNETSGSFMVYEISQYYHCFGCGAHGNVFDFLKEYHGISFKAALKILKPNLSTAPPKPDIDEYYDPETRKTLTVSNKKPPKPPTAARSHDKLCKGMDIWKAIYFDRLEPERRQKILDYCIDNYQPWQRPEHFKLFFYREWKRRMQKHPALMKAWNKNVAEYVMRRKLLRYF